MIEKNAIARLNDYGQSPWYDNVSRPCITGGELARMIGEEDLRGGTSNPTIFEKALASGDVYDDQLAQLARDERPTRDVYWELLLTDIDKAAQTLRSVHDEHDGRDGFVSIEVDPDLAHDTGRTVEQARRLLERLGSPNVMVKVPATAEGLPAISSLLAEGFNVNVTLIFALERYEQVIDAYFDGLERRVEEGGDVSRIASVASFFVSRVDTETDRRLPEGHELAGRAAVANAKLAFDTFRRRFAGERWQALANKGAQLQRPLWASTSTKNPDYPDTLYVDELVGRDTVTTLNDESVAAMRDHGDPRPDTVEQGIEEAREILAGLDHAGVDFADVTRALEVEGIEKFAASFHDALETINKRRAELSPT